MQMSQIHVLTWCRHFVSCIENMHGIREYFHCKTSNTNRYWIEYTILRGRANSIEYRPSSDRSPAKTHLLDNNCQQCNVSRHHRRAVSYSSMTAANLSVIFW